MHCTALHCTTLPPHSAQSTLGTTAYIRVMMYLESHGWSWLPVAARTRVFWHLVPCAFILGRGIESLMQLGGFLHWQEPRPAGRCTQPPTPRYAVRVWPAPTKLQWSLFPFPPLRPPLPSNVPRDSNPFEVIKTEARRWRARQQTFTSGASGGISDVFQGTTENILYSSTIFLRGIHQEYFEYIPLYSSNPT